MSALAHCLLVFRWQNELFNWGIYSSFGVLNMKGHWRGQKAFNHEQKANAFCIRECPFMLQPPTQIIYANSAMHLSSYLEIKLPNCFNIIPLKSFQTEHDTAWRKIRVRNKHETVKQSQGLYFLRSTWEVFLHSTQLLPSICSIQVKWLHHAG